MDEKVDVTESSCDKPYLMGWPKSPQIGILGVLIQYFKTINFFIRWNYFIEKNPKYKKISLKDKWNMCWSIAGVGIVITQVAKSMVKSGA